MFLIIFLLALSVLVVIHEFGHYIAARIFGVKAEEFGFGFPPRIFGIVKDGTRWKLVGARDRSEYKNTVWSLNWLPIGGFVRIKGEQEDGVNDRDSIHKKPIWQRSIIIAAGVVMNWFLAAALFTIIFSVGTVAALDGLPKDARITNRSVVIAEVLRNSPAESSGFQPGDEILRIGSASPAAATDARIMIGSQSGTMAVTVKRDAKELTLSVTPAFLAEIKKPGIGVALEDVGTVSFPFAQAAVNAAILTASLTKEIVVSLWDVVKQLFIERKVSADLSGPVGIAVMANRIAKQGITPFLQFAALLSVNLAVINFLPIPALDGGRVLFLIIEKLRRKSMSRTLEIGIHNIAFIILILIILLITARDLSRYGGIIVGGVRGMIGH